MNPMSWMHRAAVLTLAGAIVAVPAMATSSRQNTDRATPRKGEPELAPNGKGWGEHLPEGMARPGGGGGGGGHTKSNGIDYHNGPVMVNGVNIHYIWYGNWSAEAKSILTNLANDIGGSDYFNINTTYYDGSKTHVANDVSYDGSTNDNYSKGTSLSDSDIQAIVAATGPTDSDGVYFVLTSADVTATSGFCTSYCGWHTHASIKVSGVTRDIKYAFIGDPTRCPSSCEMQTVGPNGSTGADGMASIIAHELEEATTDPDLNAWYDKRGYENADKCAWTFGTTYTSANGATANMNLGGNDYLIQRNWVNASGGYCAVAYP
jgi:hypothetical protein